MNQRFACPTCNAPLTYDGRATTVGCDYCGSVVIVPENLRTTAPTQPAAASASIETVPAEVVQARQQTINDLMELVRAGRQEEATQLYQQSYKVSLKEARRTVAQLMADQQTGGTAEGGLSQRLSGWLGCLFGSEKE
jgi:hypothetical protein